MFTKQHEHELAEIKATTQQLTERFEEILQQLERIKQNQDQLAAAGQAPGGQKRKAERVRARASQANEEEASRADGEGRGRAGRRRSGGRKARAGGGRKRRRTQPAAGSEPAEE
jgi:hypothetical protein